MEHTPKNILIRAVRPMGKPKITVGEPKRADYRQAMKYLGVNPLLSRLFDGEK